MSDNHIRIYNLLFLVCNSEHALRSLRLISFYVLHVVLTRLCWLDHCTLNECVEVRRCYAC